MELKRAVRRSMANWNCMFAVGSWKLEESVVSVKDIETVKNRWKNEGC